MKTVVILFLLLLLGLAFPQASFAVPQGGACNNDADCDPGLACVHFLGGPGECVPDDHPGAGGAFGSFEAPLPGLGTDIAAFVEQNPDSAFLKYASIVINFITALIVIIGVIGVIIGGYLYMTARGSADQVGKAKAWIGSSLLGIVLALTAWLILNTISPQFANELREPELNTQN